MAIAFVEKATAVNGSSGALSATVNVPTGTANGHVMVAVVSIPSTSAVITAPAGWTAITLDTYTDSTSLQTRLWWRTASSEPANYTWNFDSSQRFAVAILSYSGASAPHAANQVNETTSQTTHTTPTISTTVSTWIVGLWSARVATTGSWANYSASAVERLDVIGTNGTLNVSLAVSDSNANVASGSISRTADTDVANGSALMAIVAIPETAGPPVNVTDKAGGVNLRGSTTPTTIGVAPVAVADKATGFRLSGIKPALKIDLVVDVGYPTALWFRGSRTTISGLFPAKLIADKASWFRAGISTSRVTIGASPVAPAPSTTRSLLDLRSEITRAIRVDEMQVTLNRALTSDGLTVSVDDATGLTAGVYEIDTELIYVSSVDETAGSLTVAPWGRGYDGTTAAAHALNSRVRVDPRFSQRDVINAINQTIGDLYPSLFGTGTTSIAYNPTQLDYALPTGADGVLAVERQVRGLTSTWAPMNRWEFRLTNSVATVRLIDAGAGDTVRVTYRKPFSMLFADTDTLASASIPDALWDALVFGALGRLLLQLEQSRLDLRSISSHERAGQVEAGAALGASRMYLQMYEQRKEMERRELMSRFRIRPHWTS